MLFWPLKCRAFGRLLFSSCSLFHVSNLFFLFPQVSCFRCSSPFLMFLVVSSSLSFPFVFSFTRRLCFRPTYFFVLRFLFLFACVRFPVLSISYFTVPFPCPPPYPREHAMTGHDPFSMYYDDMHGKPPSSCTREDSSTNINLNPNP